MSLKTDGAKVSKAREGLLAAIKVRDKAIREAYDSGDYSMVEIADETGISRQQVWEILNDGRKRKRKAA